MTRQEAIAEAHALAKQKGQPTSIHQRRLPGGTLVNDFSMVIDSKKLAAQSAERAR